MKSYVQSLKSLEYILGVRGILTTTNPYPSADTPDNRRLPFPINNKRFFIKFLMKIMSETIHM